MPELFLNRPIKKPQVQLDHVGYEFEHLQVNNTKVLI